jgi:hypothetical protein
MSADAEEAARAEARRLEAGNPLWLVVFGVSSGEFVCSPRFSVPFRAILAAKEPTALPPRMREVESSALRITISPGAG